MEVSRLGAESELQLLATATATPDPSHICDLRQSLRQRWILNPLSEARDWTHIPMDTSRICNSLSHNGNATDGQISSPASLSVISQANCVNKIASKERSEEVDEPAHSGRCRRIGPPTSVINWDYFPFSLENLPWPNRILGAGLVIGVHFLPRLPAFGLKQSFCFYQHLPLEYWLFSSKQQDWSLSTKCVIFVFLM